MACVDIKRLPLQILLRRHPEWAPRPAAVLDREDPQGTILWVNEPARALRILPGMRYAAALSLSGELRAGAVSESATAQAVRLLSRRLWAFSPRVEPSATEPGIFWLDATGLRRLYPSFEGWSRCIITDLAEAGFQAAVAVGFTRFGSYAAARARHGITVFTNPEEEQSHVRRVPLDHLELPPQLRDTLEQLGILTLGGFIALPTSGIRNRFGEEAARLHQMARGEGWQPLRPGIFRDPVCETVHLDWPEDNVERLVFLLTPALRSLLHALETRHEDLSTLAYILTLDDGNIREGAVTPAQPTREVRQILGLFRLSLEAESLTAGVVEALLRAAGEENTPQQLDLITGAVQRNIEAAERALAKVRAEFGPEAVLRARLADGHLPEAQFRWETFHRLTPPNPANVTQPPLVRRIYRPPIPLPARGGHQPGGWMIAGLAEGPVEEVIGPHAVNGGWWNGSGQSRAYYYVRPRGGRWLWIYYDQFRRRWYLHGEVE